MHCNHCIKFHKIKCCKRNISLFGIIFVTGLYFCFSLLHEAHEFLLSDARRCLELLGGSVLPFEIQESIIQMSLRKDQKVNRSLTDEIRMLGTAVYLGNVLF